MDMCQIRLGSEQARISNLHCNIIFLCTNFHPLAILLRSLIVVFISLVVFSSAMILVRALILLLLGRLYKTLLVGYVCLDLGFYLFVKIVRDDFYYWLPLSGAAEITISVLARVIVKLLADFTCIGE